MDTENENTTTPDEFIIAGDVPEATTGLDLQIKQESQSFLVEPPQFIQEETAANQDENIQIIPDESLNEPDNILAALIHNIHHDLKQELDISENEFYQESILPTKTSLEEILGANSPPGHAPKSKLLTITDVCTKTDDTEGIKQEIAEQITIEMPIPQVDTGVKEENLEPICTDGLVSIKDEPAEGYDNFYQYPHEESMDEYDGSAMGHVEACLSEDADVKMEKGAVYNNPESQGTFDKMSMKLEPDISITETHLISNKLYNSTSTVTRPHDGLIESQTTTTLVMEIRPCSSGDLLKVGKQPDEILSTTESLLKIPDDAFQLNSITGNLLPLGEVEYESPKETFPCPQCSKVYKVSYTLKNHMKVHESIERFASGRARGRLKTRERAREKRQARKIEEEKHRCECGVFPCLSKIEPKNESCPENCTRCPKRKKKKKKRFSCKFCPTDYDTRKDLFRHLSKHKNVQLLEYKAISEVVEGEQTLSCFVCSMKFENKFSELSELKSHVMEHVGPYECKLCKDSFKAVASYATHVLKVHPDSKGQSVVELLKAYTKLAQSWKCEECSINFKNADELAVHNATVHRNTKLNPDRQCLDCRRVFSTTSGLTSHRRIIHKDKTFEPQVLCVHCRKNCKDQKGLDSHMRLHSEERKFPCRFCDFRFATAERRKTHMDIHTGNLRFVCFICEYRCSSENRLKNHKLSVKHLSMKEYLLNPSTANELVKEEVKSEDKVKVKVKVKTERECDICGEKFSSEKKMLVHKQTHPFISFPNEDQPTRIFFK